MKLQPHYRYIVIDTETTGLSIQDDDIIQVGLIAFDHTWTITDRFSHYVKPEHFTADQLKPLIGYITGIDTTQIMSAPPISHIWSQIEQFFDDRTIIIGHNISFDIAMLSKYHKLMYHDTIDTMDVTKTLLHYQRSYSLEIIHQQLLSQPTYQSYLKGIQLQHHDALSDCYATYAVLRYCFDRIDQIIEQCPHIDMVMGYGQWSQYGGVAKSNNLTQQGGVINETITRKDFGFEPYDDMTPHWSHKSKGIIIDEQGNIIVATVSKACNGIYEYYDLPGGTCEEGETAEQCLIREVSEETGYQIERLTSLGTIKCYYNDVVGCNIYGFIAYTTGPQGVVSLTEREQQEGIELHHMKLDNVIACIEGYLSDTTNISLRGSYLYQSSFLRLLYHVKNSNIYRSRQIGSINLPSLKVPLASPKTMVDHDYYDRTGLASTSKLSMEHAGFTNALLKLVHPSRKMIIAFAHRAKLDLAKKILNDHGITGMGYMRENQYIDPLQLQSLGQQKQRDHDEVNRILKYCSHYIQGLSVIDHNCPGDYKVYQRMRLHRDDGDADIVLATHAGVYAALQDNTYPDHAIIFFDHQWWLSTAQKFYQSGVRIDHVITLIEGVCYKLQHSSISGEYKNRLQEFQSWWEVMWGVFGSQLQVHHSQLTRNEQGRIECIGGIPWDIMTSFTTLYHRTGEYMTTLYSLISDYDQARIRRMIDRLHLLLSDGCQIEIQTTYQGDNIIITPASTYVDYADFRALFAGRHVIFTQTVGQGTDAIVTPQYPHPPLKQYSHMSEFTYQVGQKIFIVQSSRNHCKSTFDYLMKSGLNQKTLLIGENVTGSGNKLIEQVRNGSSYVMVGGYDLYIQTLAAQISFDEVIVIGSLGSLHEQISRDITFYAS